MKNMAKVAVQFAIKHKISLGLDHETGLYFIAGPNGTPWRGLNIVELSLKPTGKSAVNMMKRYLRVARHNKTLA